MIEPACFVWANVGSHVGETFPDIVRRKTADIERYGWCLWAYSGGTGPAHPENQVRKLARRVVNDGPMTVLMPNTGEIDPGGAPFTGYSLSRAGAVEPLPTGMTPVTGSPRAWAFMLDQLEWAPWTVIDVAAYEAPFATRGPDRLSHYLKGSHGRACAAPLPDEDGHSPVLKTVDVIGRLVKPYAVFMTR